MTAECPMIDASHPILTCAEARELEAKLFAGDEAKEWAAMQRAGRAVAAAVLDDFEEIGGFPVNGRVLVLVGKGHNGGDALIAAAAILARFPAARADVVFAFGERMLRPLARRAWQALVHSAPGRVAAKAGRLAPKTGGDLCLDGIFGFQFRPPVDAATAALLARVNALPIRLRAAVDLPSAGLFRADVTYATGSVKAPVPDDGAAGRIRFLDLGFFAPDAPGQKRVLTPAVLAPLAALRPSRGDKRTYGHLFLLGGSRNYPGAILMATRSALRSGVGLVTAFVPASLVPAYAAQVPEAMWVGWPETPAGGLALEGAPLLYGRAGRATAIAIGPGLGREPETLALVTEIVKKAAVPVLLDADALQPEIVRPGKTPRVLTPHAGEFARIADGMDLEKFAAKIGATVVLKGPVTRIASSASSAGRRPGPKGRSETGPTYHSFFGGPVLARGGSGDLLAGLTGGLLAQTPGDPLLAAARGVVWHGMAADLLARAHGQVAVQTTQLLDFLSVALRGSAGTGPPAAPEAGDEP